MYVAYRPPPPSRTTYGSILESLIVLEFIVYQSGDLLREVGVIVHDPIVADLKLSLVSATL